MFRISVGEYNVACQDAGLPSLLGEYVARAARAEQIDLKNSEGHFCFLAVSRPGMGFPFLVVAQRYSPAGGGFSPGALIVPETDRLFLGAGTRLLAYDLGAPARLWEDTADFGFWSWSRFGQVVLMSGELELAGWHIDGRKLWARFVEPPWVYSVRDGVIDVDVMGEVSRVNLLTGEAVERGPR